MSDLLITTAKLEIEAVASGDKSARITALAYSGGILPINGGRYVIALDGLALPPSVPLLRDHENEIGSIVGTVRPATKSGALYIEGTLARGTQAADQVIALTQAGVELAVSVGVEPESRTYVAPNEKIKANGRRFSDPAGLILVSKSHLREISLVPLGADRLATAKIAASRSKGKTMANDFDPNEFVVSENQKTALQANFASSLPDPELEARRLNLIEGWRAHLDDSADPELKAKAADLRAKAINGEISLDELRLGSLDLIRAERPKCPPIYASNRDHEGEVLTAAFALNCGLRNPEKQFRPEVLDAATSPQFRHTGLQSVLLQAAVAGGYSLRPGDRVNQSNCRDILKAAFSTHSLTTLLSTTGNKMLLDGFNSIPQSWREVAQVRSVNDFKAVTGFRLTADLEYEEIAASGEIAHGTLGQESYTLQAKTYARMLSLTRTDIINDDLGAFDDLRNRLGIGAAIALNKRFWTTFLAASDAGTFWTGDRGNLVTGSALAEAGLNTAVAAFRVLIATDGNMMALEPALLIVPADLESTARKLYVSQEMRDPSSAAAYPTANTFFNRFKPVIVPELGNSAYTGYSPTSWFLAADPRILACAVVAFLNGQESPTIESADADFDTLGIQFRGYHDFAVSMTEYRASVKATA